MTEKYEKYRVEIYVCDGCMYESGIVVEAHVQMMREMSPPDDPAHIVVLGKFEARTVEDAKRIGNRLIDDWQKRNQ